MTWPATVALIIRARREGMTLTAEGDKLGLKADRPPSDELLALLKKHKFDILALIRPAPPSEAVGPARAMLRRIRRMGFDATLTAAGGLLISDTIGRQRDLSRRLPISEVFEVIVAGLADDPDLLDIDTAEPSDADTAPADLSSPGPIGLADGPALGFDPALLDPMTEDPS